MSYPAYAETKPSGVEWLGDVPTGWEVKRTRYVCHLNPTKSEVSGLLPETPVSFLPMEKVGTEGEVNLDEIRALEDVLQGFTYFRDGDIITAKITPCFENGKGAIVSNLTNGIGFGSTEFHVLRPYAHYAPRFIYYFTKSHSFRSWGIASMYGAGGQKRVPEDFIEDYRAAYPPLPEQQQIAAFLDRKTAELDAVLRLKERQLELLAEKRQALISQAVTRGIDPTAPRKPSGIPWLGDVPEQWEIVPLKFLSVKIGSGKTPRSGAESYVSSGIIFLRSQNVYDDGLRLDDVAFITDEVDEEMSNTRVVAGDLLLNITGASIGRTCIVPPDLPSANVNQHVCIIRLKQGLVAEFIAYFLKSNLLKQQILSFENGSSREGLNFDQVGSLLVSLPEASMPEQAAIVAHLDRETAQMDGIAQAVRTQIETVREYRQALISAAVTGKIDVRNV